MAQPEKLFVMAGMPRAGTTYIYQALQAHPDVFLPFRKELSFFTINHARGAAWYRSFFRQARTHQICGDISPDYFLHPAALPRLHAFSPRPKVILAVRDPAAWAVSFHRHIATFEWRVPAFADFLRRHPVPDNRLMNFRDRHKRATFAIADALVERTLEEYRHTFGPDLLIYSFDLFRSSPLTVMRAIEQFLDLPPKLVESQLPAGAINSSRRRNSRLLSYLLSREELITTADHLLPRSLMRATRGKFDRFTSAAPQPPPVDPDYNRDLVLARTHLASDCRYVETLLARAPIQFGDGRAFPVP